MLKLWNSSAPTRYDVWIDPNGQGRDQVVVAVAALLGLDPRLAGKLVDSNSPVRRGVLAREVHYLHARFAHWGPGVRVEPGFRSPLDLPAQVPVASPADLPFAMVVVGEWTAQGFAGLVVGGLAEIMFINIACSLFKIPGLFEPTLFVVPLLASCAIGLCWGFRRPALTSGRWMGVVGVIAVLLALEIEGSRKVERWLRTDRSSDFADVLAGMVFVAFCIALAAPIMAGLAARGGGARSRRRDVVQHKGESSGGADIPVCPEIRE